MTNEQAIKVLDEIKTNDDSLTQYIRGFDEALDMAMMALQADGNLISRQEAMDCFKKWQPYMATRLHEFEKELSELPSVAIPTTDIIDDINTEISMYENHDESADEMVMGIKSILSFRVPNKVGHWITDKFGQVICSECNGMRRDNRIYHIAYCNKCGAKMD